MIVETVEKVAPGPPSLRQAPVRSLVSPCADCAVQGAGLPGRGRDLRGGAVARPTQVTAVISDISRYNAHRSLYSIQLTMTRFQSIYIPEPVERALREWLGEVPVCLRQDVLGRSYGLLFSTIGRVTEMCSSTVPIMLASVMEAVYSPALASVDIWTDFHWHQEARLKVRALNVINRFLSLKIIVQILRNFANFVDNCRSCTCCTPRRRP